MGGTASRLYICKSVVTSTCSISASVIITTINYSADVSDVCVDRGVYITGRYHRLNDCNDTKHIAIATYYPSS